MYLKISVIYWVFGPPRHAPYHEDFRMAQRRTQWSHKPSVRTYHPPSPPHIYRSHPKHTHHPPWPPNTSAFHMCQSPPIYHPARQQGHYPLNSLVHPEDRVAFACWQMGNPHQASLGPPLNRGPFYRVYREWTATGHSRNNRLLVEALLCHYGEFNTLENPYPFTIQALARRLSREAAVATL